MAIFYSVTVNEYSSSQLLASCYPEAHSTLKGSSSHCLNKAWKTSSSWLGVWCYSSTTPVVRNTSVFTNGWVFTLSSLLAVFYIFHRDFRNLLWGQLQMTTLAKGNILFQYLSLNTWYLAYLNILTCGFIPLYWSAPFRLHLILEVFCGMACHKFIRIKSCLRWHNPYWECRKEVREEWNKDETYWTLGKKLYLGNRMHLLFVCLAVLKLCPISCCLNDPFYFPVTL